MNAAARASEPPVVRHLRALASEPRAAGSPAETKARRYAADVLRDAGFVVTEHAFEYSAFPGRYATPVAGALIGATLASASMIALAGHAIGLAGALLATGGLAAVAFARSMLGDGVLDVRLARRRGVNLVATRGDLEPRAWLMAHLDSKSQPIPSVVRVTGVIGLAIAIALVATAVALTLAGAPVRTVWWVALIVTVAGMVPMLLSVVGNESNGAVDNASGVAAVLSAAQRLDPRAPVGVVLTSAEELGLAGARAWARTMHNGIALNCDGVDDEGAMIAMYNGPCPRAVVDVLGVAARRMPLGLLTDSTALASHGWQAVTVSHGSLKTLGRIHTKSDTLSNLRGDRIGDVAELLARSAEVLSR